MQIPATDIPDVLSARDQWICWRLQERDGKVTKVPIEPSTGEYASTTDPGTWRSLDTVLESIEDVSVDGIGFVFTDDDPIVGVDIDDCRDPDTGVIDEWARDVVTRLDSYTEVSPSGTGVHVIVTGKLPDGRSRSGDIEMYETSRFFTVTGDHLDQTPLDVRRRSDELRSVHDDHVGTERGARDGRDRSNSSEAASGGVDLDDSELLDRARSAENGDRFAALWRGRTSGYPSQSEADMALCLHLAFWTGGDRARMDRLFRRSGLMREKWDEVHYADGTTYGERTIERALETVDEVYEPDRDLKQRSPLPLLWESGGESGLGAPNQSTGSAGGGESVYLEERNRLLQEKVRSQQQTIDRLANRIDELEDQLTEARSRSGRSLQPDSSVAETYHPIRRIMHWLVDA